MKKYYIIICIVFLLIPSNLITITGSANPSPIMDLSSDSSIATAINGTPIYLKSENVVFTIGKDENATVRAEYILKNTLDNEHVQTVYLPFFESPRELHISVNGEEIQYNWTSYSIRLRSIGWEDHYKRIWETNGSVREIYGNYSSWYWHSYWNAGTVKKFIAIEFQMFFDPFEEIQVVSSYQRDILSEYASLRAFMSSDYYYKCLYIARTGATWNESIEEATFTFIIHKYLLNDEWTFENTSRHDFSLSNSDYFGYDNCYLNEITSENKEYVTLSKTYTNWTPKYDIGVCWMIPRNGRENLQKEDIENEIHLIYYWIPGAIAVVQIGGLFFLYFRGKKKNNR